MTLAATDVRWQRGEALVVDGVSLTPEPGDTVGLLGPNGSGKSSLLQLMNGAVKPTSGVVTLDGADMNAMRRRDIAKVVAVVSQHADTDFDLTVADVVRLGRIPHRGAFGGDATADQRAVDAALAHTGLTDKAHRLWHRLSGGERQRAQIARALAQEPRELLLDEPTNHLDIQHQLDILTLVAGLPLSSYIALHDLNLAAMFCDRIIVLDHGTIVASGTPNEVITEHLVRTVYNVNASVTNADNYPQVTYRRPTPSDPGVHSM